MSLFSLQLFSIAKASGSRGCMTWFRADGLGVIGDCGSDARGKDLGSNDLGRSFLPD